MTQTMVEQWPGYGPPTPVRIFQWEKEFTRALELYRERSPSRVLEIGTYHGGTLYHWLDSSRHFRLLDNLQLVVSVDSYAVGVDNRHLYGDWRPDGVELVVIEGDSRDPMTVSEVRSRGPYDWVFIDAGHYYHEVFADWQTYGPMCMAGGVVLFHDILPPSEQHPEIEVERLWRQIQRAGYQTMEIVDNPEASWGGIGVVFR